jgi:hypothetical protein
MYFTCTHENRRMKPVEIVLRRGGVNLRFIARTYVNLITYSPAQLLYVNKIICEKESASGQRCGACNSQIEKQMLSTTAT